jgi:type I restriction enzyme S subunit
MSEWRQVSLTELGTLERGKSRHRPRNDPSLYGGDVPFFQTGDVKAATLHMTNASQWYSTKGVAQSRIWEPGTACITIAANISETAILGRRGCFPDSVLGFTPTYQSADAYFVKYLLDVHRGELTSAARGTTQDNLSLEKLLIYRFRVPEAPTRARIAATLRAFDDLIENNRRRVEMLEEMAKTIYREWFVHFRYPGHDGATLADSSLGPIPEGWRLERLERIAQVNRASRTPIDDETIEYLDISVLGDRSVGRLAEINGADAPGRARRIVSAGDVVWSMVRPNRRAHALLVDPGATWIASTGLAVLTPRSISSAFLFEAVSAREFSDYLVSQEGGAAYPAVKPKDFEAAIMLVPSPELDRRFEEAVACQHELVWTLRDQSAQLAATRDLLLPRLVTGRVDVSSIDLDALIEDSVA